MRTEDLLWYVDPQSDTAVTYGQMRILVGEALVKFSPICRPRTALEGLIHLCRALLLRRSTTLLHTAIPTAGLWTRGLDPTVIEQSMSYEVDRDWTVDALLSSIFTAEFDIGLTTSGSTGFPSLIQQSISSFRRGLKVSKDHACDVWGLTFSPAHTAGVQVFLQAMANRNALVDLSGLAGCDAWKALEKFGVTHISATPTFYRLLLSAQSENREIRSVSIGGEASDSSLLRKLRFAFPNAKVRNIYASTEFGALLVTDGEAFIVPPRLEKFVSEKEGHLLVHRSLLPTPTADEVEEWYDTGDEIMVIRSHPLTFRFTGNRGRTFNVAGSKVNAVEVENALREHPSVIDVKVTARPNSVTGTILIAEIILGALEVSETELRKFAAARLRATAVPRIIRFVETFSQTHSGKLVR